MTAMRAAIIDIAASKKLPTMFADRETVAKGALVSYGASYYAFARVAPRMFTEFCWGPIPQSCQSSNSTAPTSSSI
jgi:ABC-type uncharacterized transport system substrate-binding protein